MHSRNLVWCLNDPPFTAAQRRNISQASPGPVQALRQLFNLAPC